MLFRIVYLFVCLAVTTGSTAFAHQSATSTFAGTVSDESGEPLFGAAVQLIPKGVATSRYNAATDAQGEFRFLGVAPGTYEFRISFLGYATQTQTVDIESDVVVSVKLSSTTLSYDEVVVTVGRAIDQLTPVTFSNISAEELARQPDMKDLPVHLARQPSITFHSENGNAIGYSTLRMRGFDQRRLAIAINGIPQNDPEEFNVFWINFFDIQGAVQDIQIQRGAGSSVYGPTAIGGAINIRAFPYKSEFGASVQVGGGAFGTRRFSGEINSGLIKDRYVVYGRLSRLLSDGYRDWSWTEFWRFFGGVTRYGERSTLTVQAYGGPQKDGLAYAGIPKAANSSTIDDGFGGTIDRTYNFSAFDRDTENFHQPHVEVHHTLDLNSEWRINQTGFWIKGEGYFDFGGTFRSANYLRLPEGLVDSAERSAPLYVSRPEASVLFRAYLDQWQVGWMPKLSRTTEQSTTTVGLEFRLHRSLRWGRIQEASGLPAELVGPANDVRVYSFRGEKKIASAYASHLVRLSEWWAFQADAQLTTRQYRIWDEAFFGTEFSVPYLFFNPRVGVTFRPEKALSGYASIALANREPRMKNLYDGEEAGEGFQPLFEQRQDGSYDTSRPLVRPEQLVDVEVGVALRSERYRASANVFAMDFSDELVPSGGLDQYGVPRTGNADHTRHLGFEFEGSIHLATGLDLAGNFTLSQNKFISFDEFVTLPDFSSAELSRDGASIAGFPNKSGNLRLSYAWKGFRGNVMSSLVGRQYIDNGNGKDSSGNAQEDLSVDAFVLLDSSFGYTFPESSALRGLSLNVDLNNVFDSEVLTYGQVSFGSPEFFPAATRHAFFSVKYAVK
ncbi:TonB-dependent receptor [bacterium]|nr:TonB-dependent receptor [bacterium]